MKYGRRVAPLGAVCLAGLVWALPVNATELILKFKTDCLKERQAELRAQSGLALVHDLKKGLQIVRLPDALSAEQAIQLCRQWKEIEFAEPNLRAESGKLQAKAVPKPESLADQWWHINTGKKGTADADMDSPEAWNLRSDASKVVVAVIDSGIDIRHEDLARNIWRNKDEIPGNGKDDDQNGYIDDVSGYDFIDRDGEPNDAFGRGTQLAGIIGAVGNNRIGIDGVCRRVQLLPVKIFDKDGKGSLSDLLLGMEYAIAQGAQVICSSWSGGYSKSLEQMLERAKEQDVLFVTTAGDKTKNLDASPIYPAAYAIENILCASSSNAQDRLSARAGYGAWTVHLAAPGEGIITTAPGNKYVKASSSALAAAQVAGAAALLHAHGTQSPEQIRKRLMQGADKCKALDKKVSAGRLNLFYALLDATPKEELQKQAAKNRFGGHEVAPGEMLIKFRDGLSKEQRAAVLSDLGCRPIEELSDSLVRIRLPQGRTVVEGFGLCRGRKEIEFNEPNYVVKKTETLPNDTFFSGSQWCHRNTGQTGGTADADIDSSDAWELRTSAANIIVAVIDTGVDLDHPDLVANLWTNPGEIAGNGVDDDGNGQVDDIHGFDFENEDADPDDDEDHGTHCAGIIGAVGNNSEGVAGVCWNVQIMALKFLSDVGFTSDAIECINYGVNNGASVLSNSWGGGGFTNSLFNAIQNAHNNGVLFVAAAGNDGLSNDQSIPTYPAAYNVPNVIAVASSHHLDGMSSFSNFGANSVHLAAPGHSILSTITGGDYGTLSGTSMSCPQVSGACALVKAHEGGLSHTAIKQRLMDTVEKKPEFDGTTISGGRLNLFAALAASALPDLSVSVVANPASVAAGESTIITVTVENVGNVDAGVSEVNLTIDGIVPVDGDGNALFPVSISALAQGTSTSFNHQYSNIPATPDPHSVEATVDPGNAIEELNEGNNTGTAEVNIGVPDLVIGSLTTNPATAAVNGSVEVQFTVSNIGDGPAGTSAAGLYIDNQFVTSKAIPALAAGETSAVQTHTYSNIDSATNPHAILAQADISDDVTESDEDNNDSTYSLSVSSGTDRAIMFSPADGSTLTSSSVTFEWIPGNGTDQYWLYIGTSQGERNLLDLNKGSATTHAFHQVPLTGNPFYVRLWSKNGSQWIYNDYSYTGTSGDDGGDGGDDGGGSEKAEMTAPANGATITGGSQTFTWSAGSSATQYWLYIGTTQGGKNLLNKNMDASLTYAASELPTSGTIHVRLWSKVGSWVYNDYFYSLSE